MESFNDMVTQEVTRYMRAAGLSQTALGKACGIRQTSISKRIRGAVGWTLADLDRLADAGVPISLTTSTLERDAS
jgi:DNA-binding helix-turn-helix protein